MSIAVQSDLALPRDPQNPLEAATKQYVDNIAQGVDWKPSVRVATTANVTIATALNSGDALDGVTLATGDRVLVKNQTAPAENGIYVVAVSPARATDMDAWAEVPGSAVLVEEGTTQADTLWVFTANAGGTLGTTAITVVQFGSVAQLIAGGGIGLSGLTLSVAAGTGITQDADGVSIDTAVVPRKNVANTFTAAQIIDVTTGQALTLDVPDTGTWLRLTEAGVERATFAEAGNGLEIVSNGGDLSLASTTAEIDVNTARIKGLAPPAAADQAVPRSWAGRVVTGTFGDGADTTPTFTHSLNTTSILVMVLDEATKKFELAEWTADTANTVTFSYVAAPATNSKRAIVIGIQN